jgi:hypothetical protein
MVATDPFPRAIRELYALSIEKVVETVRHFAADAKVTPGKWLTKCTVDVSFVPKGDGTIDIVCKARRRRPEDEHRAYVFAVKPVDEPAVAE